MIEKIKSFLIEICIFLACGILKELNKTKQDEK
jgi:hypothetical protein